jgi:hypothetical protein
MKTGEVSLASICYNPAPINLQTTERRNSKREEKQLQKADQTPRKTTSLPHSHGSDEGRK